MRLCRTWSGAYFSGLRCVLHLRLSLLVLPLVLCVLLTYYFHSLAAPVCGSIQGLDHAGLLYCIIPGYCVVSHPCVIIIISYVFTHLSSLFAASKFGLALQILGCFQAVDASKPSVHSS
ncbi:hypothetical protein LXA43DRAFT_431748 [Ganoderma leucocontextum]|nr:hypothetical protein LXA43DRAFT_431748 [Ganoderma leucocontextum]